MAASMTPLARDLHLHGSKSFYPVHWPRPSFGDLRRLRLPAKHDGSFLPLCVGVTSLESHLARVAQGSLCAETKACPHQLSGGTPQKVWSRGEVLNPIQTHILVCLVNGPNCRELH
jgi:hypothetical protein